ncbi:TetR/AcrR family transcriptional regulator [Litorihabitans aurantiacus]|uniref:TetR family transcriptional regulator n=1 Tax=Litorihabitans aurantiacus TaxID=1930061 RepID=A0AA37UVH5_9MICO|nr:TetR/AcrR family transcriptional regulator [Litorihabitans aurantiacus]GMA31062.1 TetR family transcriptional regulator [Litorihabitans aurantiacus]
MGTSDARPAARDRLLDAADDLFHTQGIAATGVDAVLRLAGVAPATLYAHFAGKDGLVAAYLERRLERWRSTWDEALDACGEDPVARATCIFDALERFPGEDGSGAPPPSRGHGCAFLGAAVEITDVDHPAHRVLVADTALLHERLGRLADETGAARPEALAAELLALYDGALAARVRSRLVDRGWPTPPWRELAATTVERHRT